MAREIIATDKAGRTRSPLSQAVKVGDLVFVSGTTGYAADGTIAHGDFGAQMRQVMAHQPFRFLPEERDLLDSFVAQAAVAIRNASMYRAEGEARAAAEAALTHVKQLQGLLPICSYGKKIRDDRNYWERIETYISERSEVAFSHGICPECHDTIVAPQLEQWRQAQTLSLRGET